MTTEQTGDLITAAIRDADRTQSWVAEKSGMAPATLRRKIRSGAFTIPELVRVAATLGVSPAALLPAELRRESSAA